MRTPPQIVADAMPGTLPEIAERTGYPPEQVLKQIGNLRREGRRVNARIGERSIGDRGVEWTPTTFEIGGG